MDARMPVSGMSFLMAKVHVIDVTEYLSQEAGVVDYLSHRLEFTKKANSPTPAWCHEKYVTCSYLFLVFFFDVQLVSIYVSQKIVLSSKQHTGWNVAHVTKIFCTTSPLSKLPRWKLSAVVSGFFLQKHRRFPEKIWKLKHGHAAVVLGCWIARSWGEPTKRTCFRSWSGWSYHVRQDRPVNCNLPLLQPEFVSKIDFAEGEERRNCYGIKMAEVGDFWSFWGWTVLKKIQLGVKGGRSLI